jgi:hypothetical protein
MDVIELKWNPDSVLPTVNPGRAYSFSLLDGTRPPTIQKGSYPYANERFSHPHTNRLIVRFSEELMKHEHENGNRSHRAKSVIFIKGRVPKDFPENEYDCKKAYNLEKDFHGLGRIMHFLYDEQQHTVGPLPLCLLP